MNEHVTLALRQLHWLSVDRRVDFTMMHSIYTGHCPTYFPNIVRAIAVNQMGPVCDLPTPLNTLIRVVALRSANVHSHTPVLSPGRIFHRHSTESLTRNVLGNI